MKLGKWRERSQESIREAVLTYCDVNRKDPRALHRELSDADKAKLLKMVSQYYPFGERSMFPYKAWLKEVRVFREWLCRVEEPLGGLFK